MYERYPTPSYDTSRQSKCRLCGALCDKDWMVEAHNLLFCTPDHSQEFFNDTDAGQEIIRKDVIRKRGDFCR